MESYLFVMGNSSIRSKQSALASFRNMEEESSQCSGWLLYRWVMERSKTGFHSLYENVKGNYLSVLISDSIIKCLKAINLNRRCFFFQTCTVYAHFNDPLQMSYLLNIVRCIINLQSCRSLMSVLVIASPVEQTEVPIKL